MGLQVTVTGALAEAIRHDADTKRALDGAIAMFMLFNWGNVPDDDKEANDKDLQEGKGRILGRYPTPRGDIYMISYPGTDYPITVCFCDDY